MVARMLDIHAIIAVDVKHMEATLSIYTIDNKKNIFLSMIYTVHNTWSQHNGERSRFYYDIQEGNVVFLSVMLASRFWINAASIIICLISILQPNICRFVHHVSSQQLTVKSQQAEGGAYLPYGQTDN